MRTMRLAVLSVAAMAASAGMTTAATAATAVTVTCENGSCTAPISATITTAGTFTEEFTFSFPAGGFTSSALVNGALVATVGNIDFTSVTLNGVAFSILNTPSFSLADLAATLNAGGPQFLSVTGTSGGNAAFGGNVTVSGVSAVPEPATWAMMIGGFGMVGGAMR